MKAPAITISQWAKWWMTRLWALRPVTVGETRINRSRGPESHPPDLAASALRLAGYKLGQVDARRRQEHLDQVLAHHDSATQRDHRASGSYPRQNLSPRQWVEVSPGIGHAPR